MPDQEGEGHGHMHRISDRRLHLGPASCLYEVGSGLTVVTGLSMTLLNELLMQLTPWISIKIYLGLSISAMVGAHGHCTTPGAGKRLKTLIVNLAMECCTSAMALDIDSLETHGSRLCVVHRSITQALSVAGLSDNLLLFTILFPFGGESDKDACMHGVFFFIILTDSVTSPHVLNFLGSHKRLELNHWISPTSSSYRNEGK